MGAAHAAECRTIGTPVADAMAGLLEFYTVFHLAAEEVADGPVHDPCAVLAVTHPELFTFEGRPVHVELTGTHTRGMTLVDERGPRISEAGNCRVAYGVDADEVIALIMQAVREA
jgi:inosine-uridine nucleoside N-ribohydrolase